MIRFFLIGAFPLFLIACQNFSHISELDEKKSRLYLEIARGFLKKEDYPRSLEQLLKAERLNPKNSEVHLYLGIVYKKRLKFYLSKKHFSKALKLNKGYTEARIQLGDLCLEMGLHDKAFKLFKEAEEDLIYRHPEKVTLRLAKYHFLKKNYKISEKYFNKLSSEHKLNCENQILYSRNLKMLEKSEEAENEFKKTLILCKGSLESTYYYALFLFKQGRSAEARNFFNEIVSRGKKRNFYHKKSESMLKLMR